MCPMSRRGNCWDNAPLCKLSPDEYYEYITTGNYPLRGIIKEQKCSILRKVKNVLDMGYSLLVVIMVMAILLRLTITGELSLILLN